jgi:hypothetical protein
MKKTTLGVLAFALAALACSDLTAPRSRGLLVPLTVSRTVGAPDQTFSINSLPGTTVNLLTFAQDTWVTLESSGSVCFTSLPRAQGASPYYQYPGGCTDARGVYDGRINDNSQCALRVWMSGSAINTTTFGSCMSGQLLVDTVKYMKNSTFIMKRGLSPYQNSYDCDPWGAATCHTIPPGSQSVRERPIPVTLNPPSPSKRVWNFAAGQADIIFTASRTPDSLTIAGTRTAMPVAMTLWQWIGADSTRLGITGYCSMVVFPRCEFYPKESGRMVTKGYTGGWEQTTSVTVQCLASSGERAFNDSINDFKVREDLLSVLTTSNADSTPEAGWTADHKRGARHESGGVVWELPNGGGFVFVPYEDPDATQGSYHLPSSQWDLSAAPVPGALWYALVHDHPNNPGDNVYGVKKKFADGTISKYAQYPGDTLPNGQFKEIPTKAPEDSLKAGSPQDWQFVLSTGIPTFIVAKVGFVYGNVPPPQNQDFLTVPTRYSGGSASQRKCSWVKKYQG